MDKLIFYFSLIVAIVILFPFFLHAQKSIFPIPVLETYIESGIAPNSVLETDSVKFNFLGKNLTNLKDKPNYEYMLYPIDKSWKKTSSKSKSYTKLQNGYYVFFVRASKKYNKRVIYDRTPVWIPFTLKISPAYKKISLSVSSSGKQLILYNSSKIPFNTNGWRIKSLSGDFEIPKAVRYVDSSFTKIEENIILGAKEKIIIKTGISPIFMNFRPNKCFSFLPKTLKMDFSVSGYCKGFSKDELFNMRRINYFTDKCISFIKTYSCKTPDAKAMKKIENDSQCVNFVSQNLNYKGCYDKNHANSDFLSRDWRIYINIERLNFSTYDAIRILDKNGLLVAEKKIY